MRSSKSPVYAPVHAPIHPPIPGPTARPRPGGPAAHPLQAAPLPTRRHLLRAGLGAALGVGAGLGLAWPLPARADEAAVAALLRTGGVVLAFRHALAPGTFDPPQFTLGDCSTQRNLSEEGRQQARRIGAWLQARQLQPARVRSSPWCRCVDTATLAFGSAEPWAALGSPRGASESTNAQSLRALRSAVQAAAAQPGRFEVWVTHMFVLADLTQQNSSSGEGLVLRAAPQGGGVQVLGRLMVS